MRLHCYLCSQKSLTYINYYELQLTLFIKKKCLTLDKFNLLLARKKIKQCIHGTVRTSIAELVYTLIVALCIQLCIHQSDYFR